MWWDSVTTRQPTAHYHRSQQQELAPVLVLVGGDGQDTRAIHGSSRSAKVHPSAFVPNGPRLVVVATLGWCNGPLRSTRADDDDDDDDDDDADPFPGARDGQTLISWRRSLPLPTNPVWWGSMHAISSYRGNSPTHKHKHTHRQDRHCTAPQLARSVKALREDANTAPWL